MSQFTDELRVIPRGAWVTAGLVYVLQGAAIVLGPLRFEPEMKQWEFWVQALFAFGMPLMLTLYALLVGFVYGDAKRRGMRHVMWAWLALIPYFIGVAAYFIMRDPLPQPCPSCQAVLPASYTFCPHCGTPKTRICPNCGKPAEHGWANCAYCGTKLPGNGQKVETGK
jgi:hypothetical protein